MYHLPSPLPQIQKIAPMVASQHKKGAKVQLQKLAAVESRLDANLLRVDKDIAELTAEASRLAEGMGAKGVGYGLGV